MPLTPEDVRNKRFTPVRLREGYDMGEVDQFLDEVESELDRLTQENDDLRSKLSAASDSRSPEDAERTTAVPTPTTAEPVEQEQSTGAAPQQATEPATETAAPVTTIGQAAGAAARLLELATRNADEVMAEAKDEADRIVAEARTKAERVETESRSKADRMEGDARTRAEKLDSDTAGRRQQLFGDLEKDRDQLSREVEHLRSFEREYRSRLKAYFDDQLSQLEGEESVAAPLSDGDPEHTPKRLRSLPGDDDAPAQPAPASEQGEGRDQQQ